MQPGNGLLGIFILRGVNLRPLNGLFDLMNCLFQALAFAIYRSFPVTAIHVESHLLFDTLLSAEVMAGHYALHVGLPTFLTLRVLCETVAADLTPSAIQAGSLFSMGGARLDLHGGGWVFGMGWIRRKSETELSLVYVALKIPLSSTSLSPG